MILKLYSIDDALFHFDLIAWQSSPFCSLFEFVIWISWDASSYHPAHTFILTKKGLWMVPLWLNYFHLLTLWNTKRYSFVYKFFSVIYYTIYSPISDSSQSKIVYIISSSSQNSILQGDIKHTVCCHPPSLATPILPMNCKAELMMKVIWNN